MRITADVLAELDRAKIGGNQVRLSEQIARPLYIKVDKVLKAAGGKWVRKAGAHVFENDPTDLLEQVMLTGEIRLAKQELGQFYTPKALASLAADKLDIKPGMTVLEPSAGRGALADAAMEAGAGEVRCVEIDVANGPYLAKYNTDFADFLRWGTPKPEFYRILMNPPFAKQADAVHFMRALEWLKPGGRIVAIMSAAVTFRNTQLYSEIRRLVNESGLISQVAPGSFKESGTNVNAVVVTYVR